MAHYGIIGAGISGLTLAWKLKKQGHQVTIWESGTTAGGVIGSVREDDWLAESGPNSIQDSDSSVMELVESLGITNQLLEASTTAKRRYIVRDRSPHLVPNSPVSAVTTPLFSTRAKLGILLEPFRAVGGPNNPKSKRNVSNQLKDDDFDTSTDENIIEFDESLASFVDRRLGPEFLDYAINPMVGGIYAGKPERLSVKHAFPKVYALEKEFGSLIKGAIGRILERKKSGQTPHKKRVLSFKNGLSDLINALIMKLGSDLHTSQSVIKVDKKSSGQYEITTRVFTKSTVQSAPNSDGSLNPIGFTPPTVTNLFTVDELVYAGTTWRLNEIQFENIIGLPDSYLPTLNYAPVVSVTLGYPLKNILHPLDGFGVLVPEVENMNILGCLFTSSIFPNRAPAGHATLTVFVGGMRNPDMIQLPDEKLLKLIYADLNQLLGIKENPVFLHIKRWEEAIPQYEMGFSAYLKRLDDIEINNDGFHFIGNYRSGISLDACIRNSWNWKSGN
ncbi:MAG TPA: protoporphyrinogen oxidase [Bacteroidetes bacterium]|nr:protoporphyrinogen oxidase [Bacteroidota bacterium]